MAFNRDMARDLAAECLALAEKQGATVPLMIGHRMMGTTLFYAGDVGESRTHLDRVIALYDPCQAPCAGDAPWLRHWCDSFVDADESFVDTWLSRCCPCGC